jgi:hypothetical protein
MQQYWWLLAALVTSDRCQMSIPSLVLLGDKPQFPAAMLFSEGATFDSIAPDAFIALLHDLSAYFEDDFCRFADLPNELSLYFRPTTTPCGHAGLRRCTGRLHCATA